MKSPPRRGLLYVLSASRVLGRDGRQTWCVFRSETEKRLLKAVPTYNLSGNSNPSCSHVALQTRDLDAPKAPIFRKIWGDSGGP